MVQIVRNIREPDSIDVEYGGRVGISAHARRIAGDADQILDADRIRAQEFALNAQNISIAATEMEDSFDFCLLLNKLASDLSAHAGAGARTIRDIDAIDTGGLAKLRAL